MSNPEPKSQLLFDGVLVVGQFFLPDENRAVVAALNIGAELTLTPEPTNPHDKNACAVYFSKYRVGYLPKEISPTACLFLKNGFNLESRVTEVLVNKNKNFKIIVTAHRP